jgi:hypothetical protein
MIKENSSISIYLKLSFWMICLSPFFSRGQSVNSDIILENNNVRLVFADSSEFQMKRFVVNGKNLLASQSTSPWELTYRGVNGENPKLHPRLGYYKGVSVVKNEDSTTAFFKWDMVLTDTLFPVIMSVILYNNIELPEWNIEAKVPNEWVITHLVFPRISLERPDDPKIILSVGYGVEYNINTGNTLQSRYPSGTGTMQLVLMHNDSGCFYYSTKDKEGSDKIFKVNDQGDNVLFSTEITTSYAWTEKSQFSLPWGTVMGYCKNGWQDAVERWYRPFTFTTQWGKNKISERTNITSWIKDADLWLRPMHVEDNTMKEVNKALSYFGKGVGLHWYYWHNHPFDTKYPEYFPCKNDFPEMVKEAQKRGGFVTPYINGRLWDINTASYIELNGKEASCRKPDGTLYTEVYGSKVLNTVTCPSSETWKGIQSELIKRILTEIGTDGVYIDQIGAAAGEACYAENHDHPLGAGNWWHHSYRDMIKEIRLKHVKNEHALTTEENAECYIDLFDMMLIVNTPHSNYQKIVPLFPVVYSDRAIYSGYTYIPWHIRNGVFKYLTMRSLLWGAQLGWIEPGKIMKPEHEKEALFLKNCTNFRRQHHDLFLGGRFIKEIIPTGDNPTIKIPGYEKINVVLAAEWKSTDNELNIVVVNMDNQQRKVILPNERKLKIEGLSCVIIKK